MHTTSIKKMQLWCFLSFWASATSVLAEGIIDIKPFVNASINYDDNVYRISTPERAKLLLGSSDTSDVIKQLGVGVVVNLRLSRQLVNVNYSVNKNRFNQFKDLDYDGSANAFTWNWQIGSDFYGQIGTSENVSIAGFNENRIQERNLTTTSQKFASINWNLIPDWTINASRQQLSFENDSESFAFLDRDDEEYQVGINYLNQLNTNFGLSYRFVDSSFPNRLGFIQNILGDESTQKQIILTASWLPTSKTRLSTRFAQVSLDRKNSTIEDFSGFNQRWSLDHVLTGKINLSLATYKELTPVNDVFSTFVETKGVTINPVWNLTSKVLLRAGLRYEKQKFIGSSGLTLDNEDRLDETKEATLGLLYTPTTKSQVQLQYRGDERTTNLANADFKVNSLNLSFNYQY
jgi:exopolysaccharide biosynthesis operon protein EpsL